MDFMELATNLAMADIEDESGGLLRKNYIFSAVSIRAGGSIVISKNILTMNPNPAAHAERRVLAKAGKGSTLYLVRITRNGDWALAKPCKHCAAFIKNMKVKKVEYSVRPGISETWYP